MAYAFGKRSKDRMKGLHPDIIRVMERAIADTDLDFTVLEGLRTYERQRVLYRQKATRTMRSRHLTGHAIDVAPLIGGEVSWDWPLYNRLAKIIKEAAAKEGVPLEWGGDWESFRDGPHWQLPWKEYPAPAKN
jgi:peptidoglycan L-alanyl-D-glutamate endopeptidase CwlK